MQRSQKNIPLLELRTLLSQQAACHKAQNLDASALTMKVGEEATGT